MLSPGLAEDVLLCTAALLCTTLYFVLCTGLAEDAAARAFSTGFIHSIAKQMAQKRDVAQLAAPSRDQLRSWLRGKRIAL